MGIAEGKCSTPEIAVAKGKRPPNLPASLPKQSSTEHSAKENIAANGLPSTIISGSIIAQQQTTLFRDKILSEQARNALLSMDHTTAVRH
jgi:hypothetical protein